jgi:copper(I)-binding protein
MTLSERLAAWLCAALLLTATAPAAAMHHEKAAGSGAITVEQAWSRATPPRQKIGAAYLTIRNAGDTADRLVAADSPVAGTVELHSMSMTDGVMRMRPVAAIAVPAGGSATLQPGGLHIMLIGLHAPLRQGERFDLTLTFETAGTVSVPVTVGPVGGDGGHHGGKMHQKP